MPSDPQGAGLPAIADALSKPMGTSCEQEHYHNDWHVTSGHKCLISRAKALSTACRSRTKARISSPMSGPFKPLLRGPVYPPLTKDPAHAPCRETVDDDDAQRG